MHPSLSTHIASFGLVVTVLTIGLIGAARLEADLARAAPVVASAR